MRVGITGHQRLKETTDWDWVEREMERILSAVPSPLVGVTSLAIGADQLFARVVLRRGGSLELIIPFEGYEATFDAERDRDEYRDLLRRASRVETLPGHGSNEQAYLAAGQRMVDVSELVIAVWNGKPAAGIGGTGDAVDYALRQGKWTLHVNPITRQVTEFGNRL